MQGYKQRENFNSQNVLEEKRKRHFKEIQSKFINNMKASANKDSATRFIL